ncbi:hypothetical protein FB567DRAFT_605754 [Paraphoma chrysanthemicola]|uniref:Uncharacterized protein n=1 Tax=Paraphoma chrysanthemicola TaxID=798071 RepID=A0A8K0R1H1_9PLEO|nr:hypothetical protein FB567DRAFT_605754 [Paraphoma chrysanthemicola]
MHAFDFYLPPEVVGIIAHYLVCANVKDAWKLRSICASFRHAIVDDMLLRQQKDVLQNARRIMCHLLPLYLAQRTKTPLDVRTEPLDRINMMHGFVCELTECTSTQARDTLLEKLCEGIVAMTGVERIMTLLWDSREQLDDPFVKELRGGPWATTVTCLQPQYKVIAAMAIGAHGTLPNLLAHLDDRKFEYIGHSPLVAAVLLEDERLLQTILDYLATFGPFGDNSWKRLGVIYFIELAIQRETWDLVHLILKRLRSSGARTYALVFNTFHLACFCSGYMDVIRAVCDLQSHSLQRLSPIAFKKIAAVGNMAIFNLLLPAVDLNVGTVDNLQLHIALRGRNLDKVGALIDAGANVNISVKGSDDRQKQGKKKPKGKKKRRKNKMNSHSEPQHPIDVAMNMGAAEVEFLLERGAALPPFSRWNLKHRGVYGCLRGAATSISILPDTSSRTSRAWNLREKVDMDLLDLPPEIFGQVIHELVSKIGANRAWRVREVCRAFASAIAFNVLSQQPRKAFLKSKSNPKTKGTVLSNNAGIYLYYRTKVALDAKPELPAMVRGMVAYLKDGLAIQSFDSEERLLRQVCDNIGQSCKPDLILEGLRLGSQHSSMNKIGTSLSQEQKLTAATLVGSEPLMRPLLSELRPQDPGTEDLLRSPIVIAASLDISDYFICCWIS